MIKFFSPAATFAAILLAALSGATGSILQTAGNFTLLGGTGVTSSGAAGTVIKNGNVGVSPAATTSITGFPPAVIENGAIIATGAVTAKARQDLVRAKNGIAAMTSDANLSNVDLAGQTLAPGVYRFNENANLTGTVVLDAKGKNGVFWVFQIGTALTTSNGATVTVINPGSNGGSDNGIFWNCGTAINVGANNQIAGIYLAGTSIVFGANSTRGGRAYALAAITLDNNQIDARGGPGGSDYSGGLKFDSSGAVVPINDTTKLSFRYFGKHKRTTLKATCLVKGNASASAKTIQWRTGGKTWKKVTVRGNHRWVVKVSKLHPGINKLRLRARSAAGAVTPVKRVIIKRH